MEQTLFSEGLAEFQGEFTNENLIQSISLLKAKLKADKLRILVWSETRIAITLTIPVDIPPLGTYNGIDIQSSEPILLVLDTINYPRNPPMVYPDRLNFPKNQLPHLFVAVKGKPPGLCLVRGDKSEWYSTKRITDVIIRTQNWFRDAVCGTLAEDGDQYDPVRLEAYSGMFIYDYSKMVGLIKNKQSFDKDGNFTLCLFESAFSENSVAYKLIKPIQASDLDGVVEDLQKEFEKKDGSPTKKILYISYFLWSENETEHSEYAVDLPKSWGELKSFCEKYGINTLKFEEHFASSDKNFYIDIPVIVAVKRPKTIIGFSEKYELFNFRLNYLIEEGKISDSAEVKHYTHNQPLTILKAKEISGFIAKQAGINMVVGCGALGSKVVIHLARTGVINFFLCDPDKLSAHNLVRHGGHASMVGKNKAVALSDEIKEIFSEEDKLLLFSSPDKGESFFENDLYKSCNYIFDFTASNAFFQNLILVKRDLKPRICKAYISNFGDLGILFFEGLNGNPRIDDLQISLYQYAQKERFVADWLKKEFNNEDKQLQLKIGVGCNSETVILADDIISLHAASFSGIIKGHTHKAKITNGEVYLNCIYKEPHFHNQLIKFEVEPFAVYNAVNDSSWEIRIAKNVIFQILLASQRASPNETGGVFNGSVNYKTKTIHVVESISASEDSKANPVCFFRGVKGLPERIKEINEITGNQIGYVGEWHSHPHGPEALSNVDDAAVAKFKAEFEILDSPIPVFLLIVTSSKILPYVF